MALLVVMMWSEFNLVYATVWTYSSSNIVSDSETALFEENQIYRY